MRPATGPGAAMLLRSLAEIAGRIGGVRVLALIGLDGLVIERFSLDRDLDADALGAKIGAAGRAILRDYEDAGVGSLRQLSLETEEGLLMLGLLSREYALLLLADHNAEAARARFELRRAPLVFADELQ